MAGRPTHPVLRYVRGLAPAAGDAGVPDEELLARFAARRDEAAFAALLARHGPMVWGVCTRVLGGGPDTEDAFQAAFVVLARRADAVTRPGLLANWLYGVARRTALKARGRAARRRAAEREAAASAQAGAADQAERRELLLAVDEELGRLPERYRVPVVLCLLQGLTHEAAARVLRCPRQTVTTRLSRGLGRLRAVLARRGHAAPAALIAGALAGAARAMPPGLSEATVHAAAAGAVPAGAATLAREVLMSMRVGRLKWLGVLPLAAVAVAFALIRYAPADDRPPQKKPDPGPAPAAAGVKEELEALQGRWEGQSGEQDGRALGEEEVRKFLVSIKGDRMLLIPGGEWTPLAIKPDPTKSPKVLRMSPAEGPDKDKPAPAIYKVDRDADTLTLCWDVRAGKAVPEKFEAPKGSGLLLLVLKHETRPPARD